VTFSAWLKQNQQDIVPTIDRVFATLLQLVGAKGAQGKISGTGTGNRKGPGARRNQ